MEVIMAGIREKSIITGKLLSARATANKQATEKVAASLSGNATLSPGAKRLGAKRGSGASKTY